MARSTEKERLTGTGGIKGITPITLYRAKLLEGTGNMYNPVFEKHYWVKGEEEYEAMWRETEKLVQKGDQYRFSDLVTAVLNRQAAEILAERGEFSLRPVTKGRKRSNSSMREEADHGDIK